LFEVQILSLDASPFAFPVLVLSFMDIQQLEEKKKRTKMNVIWLEKVER